MNRAPWTILTKPFNKNVLISKVNVFLRLYKALDAARESSKAKSSFLANMSHEIRTPLNGIIGVTELMLRTELTDQQEKYANTIYGSGRVLHTLINDILDFSKIEAKEVKICPEPTHLLNEIKGLMDMLFPRAVENNNEFALRYESDVCHVVADINRIKQILINLAGNALKFSKDSFVVLSIIKKGETDDDVTLRFEVKDGGIGIAPDKLDAIFDRFIQADDTTTKRFGGTGLGLAICKSLIELMGGTIGVESQLREGATFWFEFTFPKCHTVDAKGDGFPVAPESLRQKRVLIVDDFQVNCDILAGFLQHWTIEHQTLTSSKQALAELEATHERGAPYDIVISD
jgi:signal transduction histidine kinase